MKINQGTSIGNKMSDSEIFAPLVIIRDGEVETYIDFEKDWKYSFINATKNFIDVVKIWSWIIAWSKESVNRTISNSNRIW